LAAAGCERIHARDALQTAPTLFKSDAMKFGLHYRNRSQAMKSNEVIVQNNSSTATLRLCENAFSAAAILTKK